MRLEVKKFKEVDIRRLSEVHLEWTQSSPFRDDSITIDSAEARFTRWAQNEDILAILAYNDSDNLVGWAYIGIDAPDWIFSGNWHPIVRPGDDESDIAMAIIAEYKRYGLETKRNRLDGQFNRITDAHQQMLEKYGTWYESQGFNRVSESVLMDLDMSGEKAFEVEIPYGFDLVPLEKKTNEELKEIFLETFRGGKDTVFVGLSDEQQVIIFNQWFDRENEFIDGASFVLQKNEEIVAFITTRPHHDNAMIGLVGVIPKYQRKGLAKILIASAINATREKGIEIIELNMDINNTPASNLYKSFGFKTDHRNMLYSWFAEGKKE
ncbi:MAG: GNAT family N-acetyltransferase [Candidatus Thorarchaeota archaeon]